jgi:hypothetical protein
VAVIDIAKVFEGHPGFKQAMEGMKQDVQQVEGTMRQLRQQIEGIRERMKQFQPGSPEYKKMEDEILKIQADGQVEGTKQKKNFIEREAGVYYSTYREIEAEVESFARQHSIGLVLRYNSTAMDPKNPQSVLEGVNSPIVYQDRINITGAITDQLARRYANTAGGPTPTKR